MKKSFLFPSLLFAALFLALTGHAQITIERNEFTRMQGFVDSVIRAVPTGITVPSEGPAQIWDYSALVKSEALTNAYLSAAGNTAFPDALNFENADLSFQSFIIPTQIFESIDDSGWFVPGWNLTDVRYSISAITGGPNDSLRFLGGPVVFDGRLDQLKFPLNYADEWTQSRIENINFQLSVAAFGLNKTPGLSKRINSHTRRVLGYGKLIIPDADGDPGMPMDVLLVKVVSTARDSIFLAGAPAPPPLMAAFGLSQGAIAADSFYVFYRENFGNPVLNINYLSNNNISAFYRPQSLDATSATHTFPVLQTVHFPNPIKAGQVLNLQLNAPLEAGLFQLTDLLGRRVLSTAITTGATHQIQLTLPENIAEGVYSYAILDEKGLPVGAGKLMVK